ncbi:hypothetical protein YC2023_065686 [Brassica napus]
MKSIRNRDMGLFPAGSSCRCACSSFSMAASTLPRHQSELLMSSARAVVCFVIHHRGSRLLLDLTSSIAVTGSLHRRSHLHRFAPLQSLTFRPSQLLHPGLSQVVVSPSFWCRLHISKPQPSWSFVVTGSRPLYLCVVAAVMSESSSPSPLVSVVAGLQIGEEKALDLLQWRLLQYLQDRSPES